MDALNIVAAIVSVCSLLFSAWIYMTSRKKEAVEQERLNSQSALLRSILGTVDAVSNQAELLGNMADREETTKKELKHLAISMLLTTKNVKDSLSEVLQVNEDWSFGIPSSYLRLKSKGESTDTGTAP